MSATAHHPLSYFSFLGRLTWTLGMQRLGGKRTQLPDPVQPTTDLFPGSHWPLQAREVRPSYGGLAGRQHQQQ